ncbi:MAG: glycosyltransferase family 2 protein [Sandaracinaceae bacterium]
MGNVRAVREDEAVSPRPPEDVASAEGVSIVIPCYNEENGVAPTLDELVRVIDEELSRLCPIEVLIVDDGSTDQTAARIEPFLGERVRLIRHPQNRGYGASIKSGVREARYDWILITDADGTYPNEHIPELLAHRTTHDMVVGARTGKVSAVPLIRRPPKWVLRKLASALSGFPIPDLNSGLRLMRKERLVEYERILPNGFSYTTTITIAMISAGNPVKYIPINYLKREGRSKIRPIADTLNFLRLIVRTVMYFDPLRVFLPLALFFVVSAIGVGVGSYVWLGRVMDVTTVTLFVTGIHLLALGMMADMLNRRIR